MLTMNSGYADDILVIKISGEVTHKDIDDLLIPAIESKLKDHASIRLWYEFTEEFVGLTVGALWDDALLSVFHFGDFSRVVMIANMEKIGTMVNTLAFMLPCPVKVFSANDRDNARSWLDESSIATV
ncbi:STAS/SEC14 domain-containing protein [Shewanella acanthi]|uniref:STAS/SEC14 domain-containing protein n=1 Tax=Shewanella acanthi TaxID=2864212 RepID=UPI001C660DE3|nr:STAS/SEC14 domain-containing protein [Shewanella acanthi]QYJ80125.1 STAS/SEC14 domain-containing protein [Shewanella acanthi]